jgi:N-acetylneuraminic acid mutarotase
MIGRRIRRWLWRLIKTVATLVLLAAAALFALRLTNPEPIDSRAWSRLVDMPGARGEVAAGCVGARLVVAGGLSGFGGTSRDVHVYEIENDRWRRGASLPRGTHHAAAASVDGWIYVSGGASAATDWTPRADVWRSHPGGAWRSSLVMPEGRQGHAMVTWGGSLFVIGGVGKTDDTLRFTPGGRWKRLAPLPVGRDHLRAAPWGDRIWVIGGRTGDPVTRVDVFDPRTNRWRTGPALPQPMSAMAVGVVDDELHVVGGEDPDLFGGRVIRSHLVLPRGDREWIEAPRPLLAVHGGGYCAHGGRLFVAGGASRQGALSTVSWTGVTQVLAGD